MTTLPTRTNAAAPRIAPWVTTGVVAAVAVVAAALGTSAIVTVAILAGAAAAIVDARRGRLPDPLVGLAGSPAAAGAAIAVAGGSLGTAGAVLAGALGFGAPLFVLHAVVPDAVGFGDVKLAAALGAGVGAVDARLGVLALCVASGAAAVAGLVRRRPTVAFGPGIVAGAGVALVSPWGFGT